MKILVKELVKKIAIFSLLCVSISIFMFASVCCAQTTTTSNIQTHSNTPTYSTPNNYNIPQSFE